MTVRLADLMRCFQGVVPSIVATCAPDGTPNATMISQVHHVDERHVALSCQFFNKTRRNFEANPRASVLLIDPLNVETYKLDLRYDHSETSGPLFDDMALRIEAIASHTGMTGVFRLISADVFEVLAVRRNEGFVDAAAAPAGTPGGVVEGPLTELRGLQLVSERINRSRDLEDLLETVLAALDELFGFAHSMVLLVDESGERLVTLASHGYGRAGVGAEIAVGDGLVGTVARERRLVRVAGVGGELRYGRAIRAEHEAHGAAAPRPEIPLPGLPDAQSQLAAPLVVQERLVGVLAAESRDPLCFASWHDAFLQIIANQIALGIERMTQLDDDDAPAPPCAEARPRCFCYYRNDDCVFVDGEYLIRNVPAKILWKLLAAHARDGRREFTNRELRLDPSLGLPPVKDNLESRLILLRKRLAEKCPDVRLVPTRRGRFTLELGCPVTLVEKDSG